MVKDRGHTRRPPIFQVLGLISFILAGLSVVALVQHAFAFGLASAMRIILHYYENILNIALSWAEPLIKHQLRTIQEWLLIDLNLDGRWKHVFVLIGIYFFRDASETLRIGRPKSAIFLVVIGLPIAAVSAIGAGCISSGSGRYWGQFLIAAIPVAGVMTYDFLKLNQYTIFLREWTAQHTGEAYEEALPYFLHRVHYVARTAAFGFTVAALGALMPFEQSGLVTLLFLVVCLSVYWSVVGVLRVPRLRMSGETFWEVYYRIGPGLLGTAMIGVLASAALFLLLNAGLSLFGL